MAGAKDQAAQMFAVLKTKIGSHTIDGVTIRAGEVAAVAKETVDKMCPETTPVKIFDSAEKAKTFLDSLKALNS